MTDINSPLPATGSDADDAPLYAPRRKIHPQAVQGRFRRIKWTVLAITLGIYYLLPFVRWDRGPNAPDQAVLIDFPNRRFYFFFVEIWPQEVYYLTGLLILAALILFLMNAVAGRAWCGYLCPQTVWTDLFYAVERFFEGDRREQIRRDGSRLTVRTFIDKAMKHWVWLLIAWWTGGAWVLYFADAPTLVKELASGTAPFAAYLWIGILTLSTYTLAGHMREQVCTYMCPWPRIQAALTDEHALNVTYRYDRGEPRASLKKSIAARAAGGKAGDCVDCAQCVAVCPTGVDIRKGLQIDCIQCGLCIDACDAVMSKIGRPTALIAYDTDLNVKARELGQPETFRIVRPRTILYGALIVLVGAVMLWSLATRDVAGISVIHDRNPVFVRLTDGGVRNAYTVRVLNKTLEARRFSIGVAGRDGLSVEAVGVAASREGEPVVEVGPDQTRELRLLVTAHEPPRVEGAIPLVFTLTPLDGGRAATARDYFRGP